MVLYTPGGTSPYPEDPVESGRRVFFLGGGDEVGNVDEPGCTHCELCIPACPVFALDIVRNNMVVSG